MATLRIELNSKPRKDGLYLIMIRATENRRLMRISSERFVKKADFNKHAEFGKWIRTSHPSHKVLNEHLRELIAKYEETQTQLIKDSGQVSLVGLQRAIANPNEDFFEPYALQEVERCVARGLYRSSQKKRQLINKIREFAGRRLRFSDIDSQFLKSYTHAQLTLGKKVNTVGTDHKALRSIIRNAVGDGVIRPELNPYLNFKITWQRTNREKLTEEEIDSIAKIPLTPGSVQSHARNMFLFSYYAAGMRFSDVLLLRWSSIRGDRLIYQMAKTADVQNIIITPPALAILAFYMQRDADPNDFVFPLLRKEAIPENYFALTALVSSKNAIVNKYLKKIVSQARISKNVSFHISRHSFAFMAVSKTGDLYAVSKSLKHKNLETTQIYLKENDNVAADNILRSVFN